jgi:hypothetical protein
MSREELEKIYEQLDAAVDQLQAVAQVLAEIRVKLASGGGPGPK